MNELTALPQSLVGRHAAISLETAEGFEDVLHYTMHTNNTKLYLDKHILLFM